MDGTVSGEGTDGPPVLQRARLGQLSKISSGGQGTAYRAPGVHLGFAPNAVFKEYKPHVLSELDIAQLKEMPRFLLAQTGATALKLVTICAWPCAMVADGDRTVGFVMPEIPDRFRVEMTTVRGTQRRPAEVQHLLNGAEYLAQRGIPLSDGDRYRLVAALASALAFLHSLGIVVGDMSPKNMMFSLLPEPAIYFIDTDAMRVRGASVSPQMESPGWAVPAGEELATVFSDRYKLGLLALRLLAGDHDVADAAALPAQTPSPIADLVRRSLMSEPTVRPAPSDWTPPALAAAQAADLRPVPAPPTAVVSTATGPSGSAIPPGAPRPTAPQQPAFSISPPAPKQTGPSVSTKVVLGSIAVIVVAIVVALIMTGSNSGDDTRTSAATTTTYRSPTTTYTYPTTRTTTTTTRTTTTTTTARTAENPGEKTTWCTEGVYAVNAVTTCGFGRNVFLAVNKSELPMTYRGITSPARSDRTFDMFCRYKSSTSSLVVCTGGDDAAVYIF